MGRESWQRNGDSGKNKFLHDFRTSLINTCPPLSRGKLTSEPSLEEARRLGAASRSALTSRVMLRRPAAAPWEDTGGHLANPFAITG